MFFRCKNWILCRKRWALGRCRSRNDHHKSEKKKMKYRSNVLLQEAKQLFINQLKIKLNSATSLLWHVQSGLFFLLALPASQQHLDTLNEHYSFHFYSTHHLQSVLTHRQTIKRSEQRTKQSADHQQKDFCIKFLFILLSN